MIVIKNKIRNEYKVISIQRLKNTTISYSINSNFRAELMRKVVTSYEAIIKCHSLGC